MNLPNKLTVLRVIMVPFFVFFMLTDVGGPAYKWIALVLFCVASLTDMLDGKIARARNLVTNFGKFMDPLADKLLVCSAMICMIPLGKLQAWFVIIIIAREFIISGFRLVAADNGIVIAASYWGKFKTVFPDVYDHCIVADLGGVFDIVGTVLIWLSLILTVVSLHRLYCKECAGADTGRYVMIVRELEKQERKYALDIIWSVFLPWMWPRCMNRKGLIHFANI